MPEPVIHLDVDVHDKLKAHCREHGGTMKEIVQRLLVGYFRQLESGIVHKKALPPRSGSQYVQTDPWQRAPFWASKTTAEDSVDATVATSQPKKQP